MIPPPRMLPAACFALCLSFGVAGCEIDIPEAPQARVIVTNQAPGHKILGIYLGVSELGPNRLDAPLFEGDSHTIKITAIDDPIYMMRVMSDFPDPVMFEMREMVMVRNREYQVTLGAQGWTYSYRD